MSTFLRRLIWEIFFVDRAQWKFYRAPSTCAEPARPYDRLTSTRRPNIDFTYPPHFPLQPLTELPEVDIRLCRFEHLGRESHRSDAVANVRNSEHRGRLVLGRGIF